MKKLLFLLLFLLFTVLANSQSNKSYKINKGDTEIQYEENTVEYKTFIEYRSYIDGKKNQEGSLIEWKFNEIKEPIYANKTTYHRISTNSWKQGEINYNYTYTFINGKVNGLQKVSKNISAGKGLKDVWAMAVINGILVGKHIIDSNDYLARRPDWENFYVVNTFREGSYYDYTLAKGRILWHIESFPENSYYNIEDLVNIFLEDFKALDNEAAWAAAAANGNNMNNRFAKPNLWEFRNLKINAAFESLEGNAIAISYGINRNDEVVLRVDPEKWENASTSKKWYILYHELGHDILNLEHGQGGRMMFNFPTKEYTWEEFFKDRDFMFDYYLKNKYKYYYPPSRSFNY
jgi:hypothetical protein